MLARPSARSLLVVGLGGGTALETVPSTVERIDVVEIEPEVVAANRAVGDRRWRDPLADPRLHLHLNDARNALLLTDTRFDAIVSQPSHPWSAGASHLYTREFFELAKSRLAPDGVFTQWIGFGFVDESLFRSLLATLTAVFENVRVYSPPPQGGALFIASDAAARRRGERGAGPRGGAGRLRAARPRWSPKTSRPGSCSTRRELVSWAGAHRTTGTPTTCSRAARRGSWTARSSGASRS